MNGVRFYYWSNTQIVSREDEDRRRREGMMHEEERLRREKEDLDFRYQKELAERHRQYESKLVIKVPKILKE